MSWHTAGHRVHGVDHFDAFGFEGLLELGNRVLGLCHSQPVAGDDDDFVGVAQKNGDVFGGAGADRTIRHLRGAC